MRLCIRLTLVLLVVVGGAVSCQNREPEKPAAPPNEVLATPSNKENATPSNKDSAALVEKLVSANGRPKGGRQPLWVEKEPILPPGFDPKEQTRVAEVCRKLKEAGTAAFPSLIDHFEDQRYSVSLEQCSSGAARHVSVGEVCHMLIMDQLQPYGFYSRGGDELGRPRRSFYDLPDSKKEATEWWSKHQHQTLDQLQLEVLDWVIAREDEGQENGKPYPEPERQYLRDLRKKLSEGKKPLPAGNSSSFEIIEPRGFAGIK